MNRRLPPYASEFRDRHGKVRIRFRMKDRPTRYAQAVPGSDEFWKEYLAWRDGETIAVGKDRNTPGTLNDLISQFYGSTQWKGIPSERTRIVYRGELERFRAKYGVHRVEDLTAQNVVKIMESMQHTPSAANNLLKRLRMILDYAVIIGMRDNNPAKVVKPIRIKSDGFHKWEEAEIAQFEARHPIGTKARLALALLLYTAQRRSDIVSMGVQHVKDGRIRVKQMKTGKDMLIPMHPRLREAIDACPSGHLAFLVSSWNKPYTKESFGNWFRKRCNEAGLQDCAAHGLRKAAASRMAEIGLSNQRIKSLTGHTSDAEVARYTRNADQVRMADEAMAELVKADLANQETGLASNNDNALKIG
jgi:integrase